MATKDILFLSDAAADKHLLWGDTSQALDSSLLLLQTGPDIPVASDRPLPADVRRVEFLPRFKGTLTGGIFKGHGIEVDTANGVVSLPGTPPAGDRLRHFIMVAIVTLNTPHPDDHTRDMFFEAEVRFFIHDSIAKLWLTPPSLTIHQNSKIIGGPQLTVLAQFDDGMMGDITLRPGLNWKSSQPAQIDVDAEGRLNAKRPDGETDITIGIGATPPPNLRSKAKVKSLPPWDKFAENSVKLKYIPGSGPGPSKVKEAINVLFLGEGFHRDEKTEFEAIVNGLVYNMRTYRTFRPLSYDLADSINYWMAFVPSPERGVSVLPLCAAIMESAGPMKVLDLSLVMPERPGPGRTEWNLRHLFYEVGYPVPKDDTGLVNEAENDNSKLAVWKRLYGKDSNGEEFKAERMRASYKGWRMSVRGKFDGQEKDVRFLLLNEKDSAFGFGMGERPRVQNSLQPNTLHFYDRRFTREDFDEFLKNLKHGATKIGDTWAAGKDRELVVIIARSERGRAENLGSSFGYVFFPLGDKLSYTMKAAANGFDTLPVGLFPAGSKGLEILIHNLSLTVAHELAHSFPLGDEYGEDKTLPRAEEAKVEGVVKESGNVQTESTLRSSAAGARLDPAKVKNALKWLWPRIEKAGLLASPPLAPGQVVPAARPFVTGQVFTIQLEPGQAKVFKKDDIVLLRKRPITAEDKPSPWMTVTKDPVGDVVEGRVIVDATKVPAIPDSSHYPAGSILYMPVLPPGKPVDAATGLHVVLNLVSPSIHKHLIATKGPLNAPVATPQVACDPDKNEAQDTRAPYVIPTNLPAGLIDSLPAKTRAKLSKHMYFIVGLYEGGHHFYCGVFHPAGVCMMKEGRRHHRGMTRFCQVCRYVLVDSIDPTKHGVVDKLYAEDEYPEPAP